MLCGHGHCSMQHCMATLTLLHCFASMVLLDEEMKERRVRQYLFVILFLTVNDYHKCIISTDRIRVRQEEEKRERTCPTSGCSVGMISFNHICVIRDRDLLFTRWSIPSMCFLIFNQYNKYKNDKYTL